MSRLRLLPLALLLVLSACSQKELLEQVASNEDQAAAKARIEQIRSRDFEGIEKDVDPSLESQGLRAKLEKMASVMPEGTPTSITLVGAHQFSDSDATSKNLTFEYSFGDKWFLSNVATKDKGGIKTIVGLSVYQMAASLEQQNKFTLQGKSPKHYAILGSAVAAVLFSLYALVVCIATKLPGRKWPWLLFILLGVGKLGLNWNSGEVLFAPFSVQLLSAGAVAPLYAPWVITVSLPLGAAVFLYRHKARNAKPLGG